MGDEGEVAAGPQIALNLFTVGVRMVQLDRRGEDMKAFLGSVVCAVAMTGFSAASVGAATPKGAAATSDKVLDSRIEQRIHSDAMLKKHHIDVSVDKGVATLTGDVVQKGTGRVRVSGGSARYGRDGLLMRLWATGPIAATDAHSRGWNIAAYQFRVRRGREGRPEDARTRLGSHDPRCVLRPFRRRP